MTDTAHRVNYTCMHTLTDCSVPCDNDYKQLDASRDYSLEVGRIGVGPVVHGARTVPSVPDTVRHGRLGE